MKMYLKIVDCNAYGMVELYRDVPIDGQLIIRMNCSRHGYENYSDMTKRITRFCHRFTEH